MIPSTFDYPLELITESSRKQDADFLKYIIPGEKPLYDRFFVS
jgi:hypothetical protein